MMQRKIDIRKEKEIYAKVTILMQRKRDIRKERKIYPKKER